jgi:predicted nucleotidyltransferase
MDDIINPDLPSGRFLLRIDPGLHALLRDEAERRGMSLNEYCARKLAAPRDASGPSAAAVHRAATVAGPHLLGILLFGSWARGEPSNDSDVDLLVVVDPALRLDRGLYRHWDESALQWEGRRVEPHFVHLPGPDDRVSGLWAEVALDGVVIFDPGFALSRRLIAIRREILVRRLLRRTVHGHPYWVEAA